MTSRPNDSERLLSHAYRTGLLPSASGEAGPVALLAEAPGLCLDDEQGLSAIGHQVSVRARHLSDLLGIGGDRPAPLADRDAALALLRQDGHDPLLYQAARDVLPARTDTRTPIRADLVVYEQGSLPGSEPYRSLGHWNPPGQVEAFEVLNGRIAMLVAGISSPSRRFSYVQTLSAGERTAVPLGAWHVSYVLTGPAVVFNIYAHPGTAADPEIDGGHDGKYQRDAPVPVTLRRSPEGQLSAVLLADWGDPLWLTPTSDPAGISGSPAWLPATESLPSLFLRSSADRWNELIDRAVS